MTSIIIAEPEDFPLPALKDLQNIGNVQRGPYTQGSLKEALSDADILIVRLGHKINEALLAEAPTLKVIVTATTGLNHIDEIYAGRRGIEILSLRGEIDFLKTISPTADLTFGLYLSLLRRIPQAALHVRQGLWDRNRFKGRDLEGLILGLYGYGRIAEKLARMGAAFGMRVLAYDIRQDIEAPPGRMVGEDELLSCADIVSLHVLHNQENSGLFSARCFSRMKPGAYFVNTARGELVDEAALLAALQSGHLAGAALDVLSAESAGGVDFVASDPLVQYACTHDNLIITPHIGGATIDSMARVEEFMTQKLLRWWAEAGKN